MRTWPEFLPNPNNDFSADTEPTVVRTQMESGRYRQRLRFTRSHNFMNVVWTFSDYEFGIFKAFHQHLLAGGADWMSINLPMGDGLKLFKARFAGGSYTAKQVPVLHWRVTATLETEDDTSPYTADEIDFLLLGLDIDDIEQASELLHTLVHETLPANL